MSTASRVGFFRELPHGDQDGPSLADAVADPLPVGLRATLAGYLQDSPVLVATTGTADDVLDPSRTEVAEISVHTDGQALWPGDLAYYVRTYGARPSPELLDRALNSAPPVLTENELEELAELILPPPPDED